MKEVEKLPELSLEYRINLLIEKLEVVNLNPYESGVIERYKNINYNDENIAVKFLNFLKGLIKKYNKETLDNGNKEIKIIKTEITVKIENLISSLLKEYEAFKNNPFKFNGKNINVTLLEVRNFLQSIESINYLISRAIIDNYQLNHELMEKLEDCQKSLNDFCKENNIPIKHEVIYPEEKAKKNSYIKIKTEEKKNKNKKKGYPYLESTTKKMINHSSNLNKYIKTSNLDENKKIRGQEIIEILLSKNMCTMNTKKDKNISTHNVEISDDLIKNSRTMQFIKIGNTYGSSINSMIYDYFGIRSDKFKISDIVIYLVRLFLDQGDKRNIYNISIKNHHIIKVPIYKSIKKSNDQATDHVVNILFEQQKNIFINMLINENYISKDYVNKIIKINISARNLRKKNQDYGCTLFSMFFKIYAFYKAQSEQEYCSEDIDKIENQLYTVRKLMPDYTVMR